MIMCKIHDSRVSKVLLVSLFFQDTKILGGWIMSLMNLSSVMNIQLKY